LHKNEVCKFARYITTLLALCFLFISIHSIEKFAGYKELLFIGSFKLFGTYLMIDWFYKGIEEFRFITVRTLIIRILYVISVFLFVKNENDYDIYYWLLSISVIVNASVNVAYSFNYIHFSFDLDVIKKMVRPITYLGIYSILAWLYNSFCTTYLGFISSDKEVGYFTTAAKLYVILLSLFSAFAGVMLPRLSSLIGKKDIAAFQVLIDKSFNLIISLTVPLVVFSVIYAPDVIKLIAGDGYEGAVWPMRLIMPLILIVGINQILIIQIMTPLKLDKLILVNTVWGAITGLALNFLLTPQYLSIGASISWVMSEVMVMLSALYFIRRRTQILFPVSILFKNVSYGVVLTPILWGIYRILDLNYLVNMTVGIVIVIVSFVFIQKLILRNPIVDEFFNLKYMSAFRSFFN
ncbi:polysaccharide biosynthesis C-terminal domain-containing protein, partial [Phocaeicola vulgatus]|uniref:oligosaccharide flippase family protein n=1 Tax=Phocaeicola vulgatus TaxID=821 RepID=UPI000E518A0F